MFKTMTFTVMHFTIAFGVAWALTGDVMIGGLVAMVEPAINSVGYIFHEKAWASFTPAASDKAIQASGIPA